MRFVPLVLRGLNSRATCCSMDLFAYFRLGGATDTHMSTDDQELLTMPVDKKTNPTKLNFDIDFSRRRTRNRSLQLARIIFPRQRLGPPRAFMLHRKPDRREISTWR